MRAYALHVPLLGCLVFAPVLARAEPAPSRAATLSGVVVDQTGAAVPGATVTIHRRALGLDHAVDADDQGRFAATPRGR
jgi:hypothetical protein